MNNNGQELIDFETIKNLPPPVFASDIPAGADPTATGRLDIPPGYHVVSIADLKLAPDAPYTRKKETYICHKLHVTLEIPPGYPYENGRLMDFIPMPCQGQIVTADMANQWFNFLRAFGFQAPAGAYAPPGFTIAALLHAKACVQVVYQLDANKKQKLSDDGRPYAGVRFFGYHHFAKYQELGPKSNPDPLAKKASMDKITL